MLKPSEFRKEGKMQMEVMHEIIDKRQIRSACSD